MTICEVEVYKTLPLNQGNEDIHNNSKPSAALDRIACGKVVVISSRSGRWARLEHPLSGWAEIYSEAGEYYMVQIGPLSFSKHGSVRPHGIGDNMYML